MSETTTLIAPELLQMREKRKQVQQAHDTLKSERDGHQAARDAAVAAADPAGVTRHSAKVAKADDELAGYVAVFEDLTARLAPLEAAEAHRIAVVRLDELRSVESDAKGHLDVALAQLSETAETAFRAAHAVVSLQKSWQVAAQERAFRQSILDGEPHQAATIQARNAATDRIGELMLRNPWVNVVMAGVPH